MREWWRKWGWVGAFTVPFMISSVFLVVAEKPPLIEGVPDVPPVPAPKGWQCGSGEA
jgi:hypothetical protein